MMSVLVERKLIAIRTIEAESERDILCIQSYVECVREGKWYEWTEE